MEEIDNIKTESKPPSDLGKQLVIGIFLLCILAYAANEILNKEETKTDQEHLHSDTIIRAPNQAVPEPTPYDRVLQPQKQEVVTTASNGNTSTASAFASPTKRYIPVNDSTASPQAVRQPLNDKHPLEEQLPDLKGTWINPQNDARWVFKQEGNHIYIEVFKRNGKKKGAATGTFVGNYIEVEYNDFNFDTYYGKLFLSEDQKNLNGKLETNLGFSLNYNLKKID